MHDDPDRAGTTALRKIDGLHNIRAAWDGASGRQDGDRITFEDIGSRQSIEVPLEDYSDPLSRVAGDPTSVDAADDACYDVHNPQIFHIGDAMLHSPFGLVGIDDFVARESIHHFPAFLLNGYKLHGEQYRESGISIPDRAPALELQVAYSMQMGIQENYYHWIVMFLGRICEEFIGGRIFQGAPALPVLLFPSFLNDVQEQTAAAIADHYKLPFLTFRQDIAIKVRYLIYPVPFRSGFLKPDRFITQTFAVLRRRFAAAEPRRPRWIYLSRRDTGNRRMVNEAAVEAFLAGRGFVILCMTGMSIAEQVSHFAQAGKIIGPHGAGLTNIGFCQPGTKLLEIHIPSHLNWCYRRLAAVCGVRYGFLYGTLETDGDMYINLKTYRVDIARLAEMLDQGF